MKRALIFDSGVSDLSVLDAIVVALLPLTLDYAADNAWLPHNTARASLAAFNACGFATLCGVDEMFAIAQGDY